MMANEIAWMEIQREWIDGEYTPRSRPRLLWGTATRGKLITIKELDEKMERGKSLARVVSMCEPLCVKHRLKGAVGPIMVGINKKGDDWRMLGHGLERWDYILTSDWSNFDASISRPLLEHAWEVIEIAVLEGVKSTEGMR